MKLSTVKRSEGEHEILRDGKPTNFYLKQAQSTRQWDVFYGNVHLLDGGELKRTFEAIDMIVSEIMTAALKDAMPK